MTKIQKEYRAGFASGHVHIAGNQLCIDNLAKMKTGIHASGRPFIQAYWRGYFDALNYRQDGCYKYITDYFLDGKMNLVDN